MKILLIVATLTLWWQHPASEHGSLHAATGRGPTYFDAPLRVVPNYLR
jgi:hypothetical protein